jgi:hypothetical protein
MRLGPEVRDEKTISSGAGAEAGEGPVAGPGVSGSTVAVSGVRDPSGKCPIGGMVDLRCRVAPGREASTFFTVAAVPESVMRMGPCAAILGA